MLDRVPLLEKELADYTDVVGAETVERIRDLARPLARRPGAAHQRHGVRRGRRRAPRHPRAPPAQRRPRRRVAGHARQRRVLRRHQAGPQRPPGGRHRVDTADAAHLPRTGARQLAAPRRASGTSSSCTTRSPRHCCSFLRDHPLLSTADTKLDLALPHRPDGREPPGVGVLPAVRRAAPRVGLDDAGVRPRVARHGPRRARAAVHRPALGEEPRARDAVLHRDHQAVRHRPAPSDRVPGQPLRPVEGPDRRDRGLPYRPRAGDRRAAGARRLDGDRRPRRLPGLGGDRGGARRRPRHPPAVEPAPGRRGADQRVPAHRERDGPEVAARGVRAHGERGAVEGTPGRRGPGRRHQAPDPRRLRRLPRRLGRGVRGAHHRSPRRPGRRRRDGSPGARARAARTSSRRASSRTGCDCSAS